MSQMILETELAMMLSLRVCEDELKNNCKHKFTFFYNYVAMFIKS